MKDIKLSFIIVNYKSFNDLLLCLHSISNQNLSFHYEVIVVNNDDENWEDDLKSKYPKIIYIKSKRNRGYGAGNNLGVKHARGEYIFILNPDTQLLGKSVISLFNFIKKDKKMGIVAPILLNGEMKPFKVQGTTQLGYLEGIIALSFINKYFPQNLISKRYWMENIKLDKPYEVEVTPGAAFLIRRSLYTQIGGFDENYFLYFEEVDLSRRIKKLGYKLYINPQAKVLHVGGQSTKHFSKKNMIFEKSRKYYFKKYYGILPATLLELFLTKVRRRKSSIVT